MSEENFCEIHGPYEAELDRCPYCARQAGGRPQAPRPLDDDQPTDPWGGRQPTHDEDLEETEPRRRPVAEAEEDLEETEVPRRRRASYEPEDEDDTVVERVETGLLGWLIVKDGMRRGQVHPIRNGTTIGRDRADIVVPDPKISRPHGKFTVEHDQFVVWDFGSENGTYVNGERIREATPLNENDIIRMGDTSLVLKTMI
jgi:hypothetical protein